MMRRRPMRMLFSCALAAGTALAVLATAYEDVSADWWRRGEPSTVQLGPRPYYLVDRMPDGPLKRDLQRCENRRFESEAFSIGHRGAPLQFPEHTRESYEAAARMGAGILECDVTFTADGELVCRHAQCDLHTTTDILLRPELAARCTEGFQPATFNADGSLATPASATCCASDLTAEQFKGLCGKMDASDPTATTPEEYQGGTASFRTDLYSTCAEVLTHPESIRLFDRLGTQFTPELKEGNPEDVSAVFGSQANYARAMIDDYVEARIHPREVFPQSFNLDDVRYWIDETRYGRQAVFLDGGAIPNPDPGPFLRDLRDQGVRIVAPPMPMLLTLNAQNEIVPSDYAIEAKRAGLDVITWTAERSGRLVEDVLVGGGSFYYQTILGGLSGDGDVMTTIHVLAEDVGVRGIFSDWPAVTTYYAGCMKP